MIKSAISFGLFFLLCATAGAKGNFLINPSEGEWKYRSSHGNTHLLFYTNGYDQVSFADGICDTISVRFKNEDAPVVTSEGNHIDPVLVNTSKLSGTFLSCDRVRYDLANGITVFFELKNNDLVRTVTGNSQNDIRSFSLLVSNGLVFPPMGETNRHNSVVMLGRNGRQVVERCASNVPNEFSVPEILSAGAGVIELRYHLPVNVQSGDFSLIWLTYIGATDVDELFAVRDLPDGGVVVCGRTMSLNFPGTDSNDSLAGGYDMVIFRMDSAGQVVWTTIYGGLYFESANGMLVNDSIIYVTGATNGNDIPLVNAYQTTTGGSYDAVVLKMDFNGVIQQSSYFGGFGAEQGYGIALDSTGRIVIGGSSTSSSIPMSTLGYQTAGGGAVDGFIAVLNDSFAPQWSTFYGGSSSEDVHNLTITPKQKIVMIGASFSLNFPCTPNAFQPGRLGICDAYFVVFDMQGNREYATYYGGSSGEDCFGVAGDSAGNIFLAGHTSSIDFNITGTTIQSSYSGLNDSWVAKFDTAMVPVFSTFFGGSMDERTWGMQLRGAYLYVAGSSESNNLMMNVTSPQDSLRGGFDGFVLKMDTAGHYVTSTYLGGSGADEIYALTVNADTMVTCVGSTYSSNLDVTVGAYQTSYVGSGDGFVTRYKLSEELFSSSAPNESSSQESVAGVFPNPTNGEFVTITSANGIASVVLTDVQGREVSFQVTTQSTTVQLNIGGIAPGVYVVHCENSDGEVSIGRMIIN